MELRVVLLAAMSPRQKIGGTSLKFFYVAQFPILPPSAYTAADLASIVPRVLELTYTKPRDGTVRTRSRL